MFFLCDTELMMLWTMLWTEMLC